MKVWIAFQEVDYEGSLILSVHRVEKEAHEAIEFDKKERARLLRLPYDSYSVEEHLVR